MATTLIMSFSNEVLVDVINVTNVSNVDNHKVLDFLVPTTSLLAYNVSLSL